jgi:hypothetical protein
MVFEIRTHAALWLCLSLQTKIPKDLDSKSLISYIILLLLLGNKKDVEIESFGLLVCGLMTSAICPHRYFDLKLGQFGHCRTGSDADY